MIKLIDILEAKQVGLLYHFTTLSRLISILESNLLKASDAWSLTNDPRPFNSFTRNKNGWEVGGFPTNVRIDIDGNKLSNKYKIQPFNMDFGVDEMEERIYKDIPNIKNYILGITINTEHFKNIKNYNPQPEIDYINSLYPGVKVV